MTYTKEQNRVYQLAYYHRRRRSFFEDKACVRCGATEKLELHHRDPAEKESNSIWTWSAERRLTEIAKCDVLCQSCHIEHHRGQKKAFASARRRRPNGTFLESSDGSGRTAA